MCAHRIALAPPFPGLWQFKQGRNSQQWMGNNSKALMKVLFPFSSYHLSMCLFICSLPVLGLGVSNWRICPSRYHSMFYLLPRLLLHRTVIRFHSINAWLPWWGTQTISQVPVSFPTHWCLGPHFCRVFSSTPTLNDSLPPTYWKLWRSEWPMFLHHRVKTYLSCQTPMAPF